MFDDLQPLRLLLLLAAGAVSGFINVNAGGGSLLTLPALIFLGMPSTMANATNRVGIVMQNTVASATFRRRGRLPMRLGLSLLLAGAPGAYLGTQIALELDEVWFRRILAVVLVAVLFAILRGSTAQGESDAEPSPPHPLLLHLSYFGLGIYAGLIQAGAGFLLIAALTRLGGLDLIRSNAVKVFTVLFLQILSLAVFWKQGQVQWIPGLVLGVGAMAGAWVGTHMQIDHGERWVRRFLVICLLAVAAKLLVDSFRAA